MPDPSHEELVDVGFILSGQLGVVQIVLFCEDQGLFD